MSRIDYNGIARAADIYAVARALGLDVDEHNKAICPFHADRRPSLHLYADGYHCFVCGAHGDVIDLVEGVQHCCKREAAEIVARLSGGELLKLNAAAHDAAAKRKRAAERLETDLARRDDLADRIEQTRALIAASVPYSATWSGAYRALDRLLMEYEIVDGRIVKANARRLEEKNERKNRNSNRGR